MYCWEPWLSAVHPGDMMDINSDRVAFEEDNRLNNANDSIYSVMGILPKYRKWQTAAS